MRSGVGLKGGLGGSMVVVLAVFAGACGGFSAVRMQNPVPLDGPEPSSSCERDRMRELVLSEGFSEDSRTYGVGNAMVEHTLVRESVGYGIYPVGDDDPLALAPLRELMDEEELEHLHRQRIEPTQTRASNAAWTRNLGFVGVLGGVGLTIGSVASDADSAVTITGLVLAGAGLVAYLTGHFMEPSQSEVTFANTREYLFFPEEDDMDAVKRGVSNLNRQAQASCAAGR